MPGGEDAMILLVCPECQSRYRVESARLQAGPDRVRCARCSHVFVWSQAVRPETAPLSPSAPVTPAPVLPPLVLIVDDSKFFREVIVDVLRPLPLRCLGVSSAEETLTLLRNERPALLLIDINLPGMNGYDLIRTIRADPALASVRILVLSAIHRRESDATAATAAGADDFMSKSFSPDQLQMRVRKLLEGSS